MEGKRRLWNVNEEDEYLVLFKIDRCGTADEMASLWGGQRMGEDTLRTCRDCDFPRALSFVLNQEGEHLLSLAGTRETAQVFIDRMDLTEDEAEKYLREAGKREGGARKRREQVKQEEWGEALLEIDRVGRENSGDAVMAFRAMEEVNDKGEVGDGLERSSECGLAWALRFFLSQRCETDRASTRPVFDILSSWDGFEDRFSPLWQSVSFHEYDQVVSLLANGAKGINRGDLFDGETPLRTAASRDQAWMVRLLLEAGADVHAVNKDGETALHCSDLSLEIVRLLVDGGAEVNARTAQGQLPLSYADSDFAFSEFLVDKGAILFDDTDPDNPKRIEDSALCRTDDPKFMVLYLKALLTSPEIHSASKAFDPAGPSVPPEVRLRILCATIRFREQLEQKGLFQHMAMHSSLDMNINNTSLLGLTPLQHVNQAFEPVRDETTKEARRRNRKRVRALGILSECGASVLGMPDNGYDPSTANSSEVHQVAHGFDSQKLVKLLGSLTKEKASLAVNSTEDDLGRTPLHCASDGGMVRALVDAGAKVRFDEDGRTPLHYFASRAPRSTFDRSEDFNKELTTSILHARDRYGRTAEDVARKLRKTYKGGGSLIANFLTFLTTHPKYRPPTLLQRLSPFFFTFVLFPLQLVLTIPLTALVLTLSVLSSAAPLGGVLGHCLYLIEIKPVVTGATSLSLYALLFAIFFIIPRYLFAGWTEDNQQIYFRSFTGLLFVLPQAWVLFRLLLHRFALPHNDRRGRLFFKVPQPKGAIRLLGKPDPASDKYYKVFWKIAVPFNFKNVLALVGLVLAAWQSLSVLFLPKITWTDATPQARWFKRVILSPLDIGGETVYLGRFYASVALSLFAQLLYSYVVTGMAVSSVQFVPGDKPMVTDRKGLVGWMALRYPFLSRSFLKRLPLGPELAGFLTTVGLNFATTAVLQLFTCESGRVEVLPTLTCWSYDHVWYVGVGSIALIVMSTSGLALWLTFVREHHDYDDIRITPAFQLVNLVSQVAAIVLGAFFPTRAGILQSFALVTTAARTFMVLHRRPCRDIRSINLFLLFTVVLQMWLAVCNLTSVVLSPTSQVKQTVIQGRAVEYKSKDKIPAVMLAVGWGLLLLLIPVIVRFTSLFVPSKAAAAAAPEK